MDFLKDIVKEIGNEYTQLASDIDETERYVDTGSYIFNGPVSYTHLRAHETGRNLVCRLLLEKKK